MFAGVPGLWMVETVDTVKAARTLNRHWLYREKGEGPLRVLVQVNISSEPGQLKFTASLSVTVCVIIINCCLCGVPQHQVSMA